MARRAAIELVRSVEDWFRACFSAAHDPRQGREAGDDEGHKPKDIHETDDACLAFHHLIHHGERLFRSGDSVEALAHEHGDQAIHHAFEIGIAEVGMAGHVVNVALIFTREVSGQERGADAAAQVSREVGHTGDLITLFSGHADVVERADGNKDKRHEDDLDHAKAHHSLERNLQIDDGHHMQRGGGAKEADSDEQTRVDFCRQQHTHYGHHDDEHHARWGKRHTGALGRIAETALQELRDEHRCAEEHHAEREREEDRCSEIAIVEQAHVHDGIVVIPLPDEEGDEYRNGEAEERGDEVRREPVIFLALIEHHLQAAEADDDQAEANVVDADAGFLFFLEPWRIFDKAAG